MEAGECAKLRGAKAWNEEKYGLGVELESIEVEALSHSQRQVKAIANKAFWEERITQANMFH